MTLLRLEPDNWISSIWETSSSVVHSVQLRLQGIGQHGVDSWSLQLYVVLNISPSVWIFLYVFSSLTASEDHWWFPPSLIFQGLFSDRLWARPCLVLFWLLWQQSHCMFRKLFIIRSVVFHLNSVLCLFFPNGFVGCIWLTRPPSDVYDWLQLVRLQFVLIKLDTSWPHG